MRRFTEYGFEEWIELSFQQNGYSSFTHSNEYEPLYDKDICLLKETLLQFIRDSQIEEYERLGIVLGESPDAHILSLISKHLTDPNKDGVLSLLRNGITTRSCRFELVYFEPKNALNEDHKSRFLKNKFTLVRQLHYSKTSRKSLDMVVFLNGFPICTLELKNHLTGQSRLDAEKQYRRDRDPKEPLFQFKRCLVHFALDNDTASMTTKLDGEKTKFFPYNKGITNPVVENNYRTEYLWNKILSPKSLLDIIENFALISKEKTPEWSPEKKSFVEKKSVSLIFPRYHQLEVTRKLKEAIVQDGIGTNYLLQLSTGSGKSYSIGWLAQTLTSLYQKQGDKKRMFDTILILTDRTVLDRQLQNLLSMMEQMPGVVNNVNINSQQLKEYIEKGKDIIITTIQKFPVISEQLSESKSRSFAIIVDEVHSSQSGETSKHIKKALSQNEGNEQVDEAPKEDWEQLLLEDMKLRGKQNHISYFGFTGTPKNKTLELFGRKGTDGRFYPFYLYSMKQSIYEGYTLDVLSNYTTYKRYFKVKMKDGRDEDLELPKGKGSRILIHIVDDNPIVIEKKVSIILDHFSSITAKKINGRARGMVVVSSRKHCVLYQREMVKQMKQKGLPYSCLVAFSGTVRIDGIEFREDILNTENGMQGKEIPLGFKDPRFRILIVSNKFQTGYDEPLLHSMFIDKNMSGIQCVQTLSRLNRKTSGKDDTFVLDFVNDNEVIVQAFQPYYTSTVLSEETEPDQLYEVLDSIKKYHLYTPFEVEVFCKEFYSKSNSSENVESLLALVKNKYDELSQESKDAFKSKVQSFLRQYSYISQLINFQEKDWEMNYIFLSFLNKKIRSTEDREKISLVDIVDLDSIRIQLISQAQLKLEDKEGAVDPLGDEKSSKSKDEEKELLSEIIVKVNSIFGEQLKDEDKLNLELIQKQLTENEQISQVLKANNSYENKFDFVKNQLQETIVGYHADRTDFYVKLMHPEVFPLLVKDMMSLLTSFHNASGGR